MQLISVVARSEHVVEIGNWPAWYAAVVAAFVLLIGALAVLDARTHRIPNRIVYPALAAGAIHAFVQPIGPWWSFVAAGVIAGLLLIAIGVASGGGLGFGDAKLAAVIGLLTGWPAVLVALFVAFAAGALVSVALVAAGRLGRREPVPFAPALAAGTLIALAVGDAPARWLWPGLT